MTPKQSFILTSPHRHLTEETILPILELQTEYKA